MNTLPGNHSGEAEPNNLDRFFDGSFKEVDMQFNLTRTEGLDPEGFDVINRVEGRFLVTPPSSEKSEQLIRSKLGEHAVLAALEYKEDYSLYKVPKGARLLARTLQNPPYETPYMRLLAKRADGLLRKLENLDPNAFGVTPEKIAIGHNGGSDDTGEDDTFLMVVPPLKDPVENTEPEDPKQKPNTPGDYSAILEYYIQTIPAENKAQIDPTNFSNLHSKSAREKYNVANSPTLAELRQQKLIDVSRADIWNWLVTRHPR